MARLNQERQDKLEPKRMESCLKELRDRGYIADAVSSNEICIYVDDGWSIKFWPYSGWHTGKNIKDSRGFKKLLEQLTKIQQRTIDNT